MESIRPLTRIPLIAACSLSALSLAHAEPPAAFQADQFVDSVGVAVHLNYPTYSNYTSLKPLLTGLGAATSTSNYSHHFGLLHSDLSLKLGLRYAATNPDSVLNFNFASVQFSASPDGVSNWTTVPTFLGPIDKTETGEAQQSAGWFVTVSPAGALPAGTNYLKLSINSTTGAADKPSLFQMVIDQSGVEEAETYLPTAVVSGTTATAATAANASGGQLVVLNATGSGQYIEFTVPNLPAGHYSLGYRFLKGPNRGVAQLSFDGANVGGTADDYEATTPYVTSMRGNITVSTAGSHQVRFTVTGKNSNISGYTLGIDRMIFQAQ